MLASIGLYGVLAFFVLRRRRELGVRAALGASAQDLSRLVIGEALRLTLLGCLSGYAGFALLGVAMQSLLFGVEPFDGLASMTAVLVITGAALLSSAAPSWRAIRTSPMEVLRHE